MKLVLLCYWTDTCCRTAVNRDLFVLGESDDAGLQMVHDLLDTADVHGMYEF